MNELPRTSMALTIIVIGPDSLLHGVYAANFLFPD